MQYKEIPPDQAIAHIIECYWLCHNRTDDIQQQILPDGCIDIICDLNNFNNIDVVGTFSQAKNLTINNGFKKFGIRFKPGQFNAFININAEELKDQVVSLDSISGACQKLKLAEHLASHQENIITTLNQHFKSTFDSDHQYSQLFDDINNKISRSILSGRVTVDAVCRYTGFSRQHLRRLYLNYVGLTLKDYIDITRIRLVSQNASNFNYSAWLAMACNAGFHDQSHLSTHFRKYVNMSPKKYYDLKADMLHFYNTN